jgi:hypothetical protein
MNAAITAISMVDVSESILINVQFPASRTLRPSYRFVQHEQTDSWSSSHDRRRIG